MRQVIVLPYRLLNGLYNAFHVCDCCSYIDTSFPISTQFPAKNQAKCLSIVSKSPNIQKRINRKV